MAFKTWQKIRIRDRLHEYRVDERGDHQDKLPIATLLAQLKNFATPETKGISMESTLVLEDEALRRYAKGPKNYLADEKLDVVKDFLTEEGYLLEADLEHESKPVADLFRAHRFLANRTEAAFQRLALLAEGTYIAKPMPGDHSRNVELEISHEPGDAFCHVIEHDYLIKHKYVAGADLYRDRPKIRPKTMRIGFGFLATERNLLHIFLVGASESDRVHYLEVAGLGGQRNPHLLRVGGHNLMLPINIARTNELSACGIFSYAQKGNENADGSPEWERLAQGPFHEGLVKPEKRTTEQKITIFRADPPDASQANLELIRAAQGISETPVRTALSRGGDPNYQDADGMTALHHAAAVGSRAGIRVLVGSGKCDYLIPDNYGRFAAQLASEMSQDFAVARLLTKKRIAQARAQGVSPWKR